MSLMHCHNDLLPFMSWLTSTQPLTQDTGWAPKVDIKEEKDEFIVYADIPGVDPKDIQIDVEGNTLTVKGERQTFHQEKGKAESYYRVERSYGKFYRQFTLPETIDAERISAQSKHGVLALHLPKAREVVNQRRIEVKAQP